MQSLEEQIRNIRLQEVERLQNESDQELERLQKEAEKQSAYDAEWKERQRLYDLEEMKLAAPTQERLEHFYKIFIASYELARKQPLPLKDIILQIGESMHEDRFDALTALVKTRFTELSFRVEEDKYHNKTYDWVDSSMRWTWKLHIYLA